MPPEWQVASLVRGRSAADVEPGTELIEADARDTEAVIEAARGADVVLHALNPPYTQWSMAALPLAEAAIEAARESGATLVFPGNLYIYGAAIPAIVDETAPIRPTSRKGEIRAAIEARLHAAADQGVRVIILRGGDFFGGAGIGSYFDRIVIREIAAGRITYPGPLDVVHEWAYVPDFCDAMRRLVEARAGLEPFAPIRLSRPRRHRPRSGRRDRAGLRARFQGERHAVDAAAHARHRGADLPRAFRSGLSVVDTARHRRHPPGSRNRRHPPHAPRPRRRIGAAATRHQAAAGGQAVMVDSLRSLNSVLGGLGTGIQAGVQVASAFPPPNGRMGRDLYPARCFSIS